jgi:predicted amidohydrolase YtcJ
MIRRAAFLSAVLVTCGSLFAEDPADRIWSGGTIITMNDAAMTAQAVAERDGKIVAVGSVDDVMKLKGDKTQVIDIAGKTMLPGFVDAHGHVVFGGLQRLSANLLPPPDGGVTDIPSLQQTLRDWINANQAAIKKANLIVGFGYEPALMKEQRHPNRDELDAISKDIPILLVHQSGHLYTVNSKVLEICGITKDTPNPAGGVIRRRAGSQEPDGVLEETAGMPVLAKLLGGLGEEGFRAFIESGTELWASYGYTTAQEGRATPATSELIRQVGKEGKLKIDVAIYPDVLVNRDYIKANVSKTYENRTRVAGAKLTIDGSVQGFTAWRDRPYYNPPKGLYPPGYAGYAAASPEMVNGAIDWAYANNIQIITHANGEAASDMLIATIKAAAEKHGGGDRRAVLIHGQLLREDQVDSYNQLGVVPSLFPMHTFYWGDMHRDQTVGPAAADNTSPTGWCVQRGMKFTSHHDAPVAFPDSFRVLDATVTRRSRSGDIIGPSQRVDVITGLKAMTIWSAYQHFEEDKKGSIEVGKLADLIIVSKDPTAIDPETLDSIKVLETIKEGQVIWTRKEGQASNEAIGPVIASTLSGLSSYREGKSVQGNSHASTCFSATILSLSAGMALPRDRELLSNEPAR